MSTSRRSRIRNAAATALAAMVALAGCGGDEGGADDSDAGGGNDQQAETTPESEGGVEEGGGAATTARELFASTCGGCHTLSDAGTTGNVGPNLDDTDMDAAQVAQKIEEGGGGMPPNLLQGAERDQVAEYVAGAASS